MKIVAVSCFSSKNSNDHDHITPHHHPLKHSSNTGNTPRLLLLLLFHYTSYHRATPLAMSAVATVQKPGAVHIPRLVLPCSQEAGGDDVGNPQFRRQINVALGRAHSQRTPRRDVSFHVKQGVRQEKQRPLLLGSSSARTNPSSGEVDGVFSSVRCVEARTLFCWETGPIFGRHMMFAKLFACIT